MFLIHDVSTDNTLQVTQIVVLILDGIGVKVGANVVHVAPFDLVSSGSTHVVGHVHIGHLCFLKSALRLLVIFQTVVSALRELRCTLVVVIEAKGLTCLAALLLFGLLLLFLLAVGLFDVFLLFGKLLQSLSLLLNVVLILPVIPITTLLA